MKTAIGILAFLAVAPVTVAAQDAVRTVSSSDVWYAPIVEARFPQGIPIHGVTYLLNELPVLATDITRFQLSASAVQAAGTRAMQVSGTVELSPLSGPFDVFDGAQGRRYMLHLNAYLFSPAGRLVWQQQGFPAGGAWVAASGSEADFTLVSQYDGSLRGHELLIVAAGDPILSSSNETRVLLGALRRILD